MFKSFTKLFGGTKEKTPDLAPIPAQAEPHHQPDNERLFEQTSQNQATRTVPSEHNISTATEATRNSLIGKIWDVLSGHTSEDSNRAENLNQAEHFTVPTRLLEADTLEEQFEQIEEILLRADVGLDTALSITDSLRQKQAELKTPQDVMAFLRQSFNDILLPYAINPQEPLQRSTHQEGLNIVLVVGVNGAGKTTFIGKMAHQLLQQNRHVVIGAGDTFRAAATEQLEVWAERAGAFFISGKENADPASVLYDALQAARDQQADTVLLDTAGRLQNKYNLMEELRKIRKVIEKDMAAHAQNGQSIDSLEVLLVLDATTGQNALKQAEVFKEAVDITGVVLTKLDGSAKGGIIFCVAKDFKLPVKLVGIGEKITDLKPFIATEFINSLFSKFR